MRAVIVLCFLFSGVHLDYYELESFFSDISRIEGMNVVTVPKIFNALLKKEALNIIERDSVPDKEAVGRAIRSIDRIIMVDYSGCDSASVELTEKSFKSISGQPALPDTARVQTYTSSSDGAGCIDRMVLYFSKVRSFIIFHGRFEF